MRTNILPYTYIHMLLGWFHEVYSCGVPSSSSAPSEDTTASSGDVGCEGHVHMALNYWFHPPDVQADFSEYDDLKEKGRNSDPKIMSNTALKISTTSDIAGGIERKAVDILSYDRPYFSSFWSDDWARRNKRLMSL